MKTETQNEHSRSILLTIFIGMAFVFTLIQFVMRLKLGGADAWYRGTELYYDANVPWYHNAYVWGIIGFIQGVSLILPVLAIKKKSWKILGIIIVTLIIIQNVWFFVNSLNY